MSWLGHLARTAASAGRGVLRLDREVFVVEQENGHGKQSGKIF